MDYRAKTLANEVFFHVFMHHQMHRWLSRVSPFYSFVYKGREAADTQGAIISIPTALAQRHDTSGGAPQNFLSQKFLRDFTLLNISHLGQRWVKWVRDIKRYELQVIKLVSHTPWRLSLINHIAYWKVAKKVDLNSSHLKRKFCNCSLDGYGDHFTIHTNIKSLYCTLDIKIMLYDNYTSENLHSKLRGLSLHFRIQKQ